MSTDWRALCEELLEAWTVELGELSEGNRLCKRARAALAQPEPEVAELSDKELEAGFRAWYCQRHGFSYFGAVPLVELIEWTRDFATHWGRPAPVPAGEVGELARLLRLDAELERSDGMPQAAARFDRAADLLECLAASVPMPTNERNWDRIFSPSGGYEMADDAALRDGAQLVNGEWWAPVFGCDSLEHTLTRIRERLERRPAPAAEGEVGELVADLRECAASCTLASKRYWAEPMRRAADLLSIAYATGPEVWEPIAQLPQQRHPAPVPVSERLPGPEDCISNPRNGQGEWCWGWVQHDPLPYSGRWRMMRREWVAEDAVAWLPATALPLPQGEVQP